MTEHREKVAKKYRGLFEGFCFKFEGLQDKIKESLEKLVQLLGAKVSEDATVIFVQKSYVDNEIIKRKQTLYNVSYIKDSVNSMQALELTDYILSSNQSSQNTLKNKPMCHAAQFIYRIHCCHEFYYSNIFCKKCIEEECYKAAHKAISVTHSSCKSEEQSAARPSVKVVEWMITSSKRPQLSDSEEESNDKKQLESNSERKKPVRKRSRNSNENDSNTNYCKDESFKRSVVYSPLQQKMIVQRKEDAEEDMDRDDDLPESKPANIFQQMMPNQAGSDIFFDKLEEEANHYFKGKCWWLNEVIAEEERCKVKDCTFEPIIHRYHNPAERVMSLVEKKILIKYLIQTISIENAKGRDVYESMIKQGYLKHRTGETLRNCFRKTIIDEIQNYELDVHYLERFKALRVNSSKKRATQTKNREKPASRSMSK